MKNIALFNGKFLPLNEVSIPITDRGFLYGDGVFTSLKVSEGKIECGEAHLDRLIVQCHTLGINTPPISHHLLKDLVIHNHAKKGSWRLKIIVTGGMNSSLSLAPRPSGSLAPRPSGQVIMTLTLLDEEPPPTPLRLIQFPNAISYPSAQFKTLAYLNRFFIKEYACQHGFDDAIVENGEKILLEASSSNIFWREGTSIFTPDHQLPLMQGVSLMIVKEVAQSMGMNFYEVQAKLSDISANAQFFICNSIRGLSSVERIGQRLFTSDSAFKEVLIKNYLDLIAKYSLDCFS